MYKVVKRCSNELCQAHSTSMKPYSNSFEHLDTAISFAKQKRKKDNAASCPCCGHPLVIQVVTSFELLP